MQFFTHCVVISSKGDGNGRNVNRDVEKMRMGMEC